MSVSERTKALGNWGERKALELLRRCGFQSVRDLNSDTANHLFADVFAERSGRRFIVGVRTRNKRTAAGPLNSAYNVCKKGRDLSGLRFRYDADLACLAVQVHAEAQSFSAFFVTIAQLTQGADRYSVPMTEKATEQYECLARDEYDPAIKPEWSNQTVLGQSRANRGEEIASIPREGTKDRKKFDLLIRRPISGPPGATLDELNRVTGHDAWSYINDTKRLAKRCGGTPHWNGDGGKRRFWIAMIP